MGLRNETLSFLRTALPNLKDYKTDIATDLLKIFHERAERFKASADEDELESVERHIEELKSVVIAPKMHNKVYIVSAIERLLLIALGISDFEADQLKDVFGAAKTCDIDFEYISTLYVIRKEKIVFTTDLNPGELAIALKYFNDKNLIPTYDIKEFDKFHIL